ncbi:MAG: 2-oxo acid dehydrogenase subunit E2 [Clostridia bacterium]
MTTNKKRWGDRRDAVWLRDLDALHVFMPYLYPNRADNEAFISETIDLENIDRYLAEKNAALPDGEEPYKLFYLLLSALVKTITLRPKMNRFIKGGRVYQRDKLSLAFVVKKQFRDDAHEALAFIEFDEKTTIDDVRRKLAAEIHACRSDKIDNSTAGMEMLGRLPRPVLRLVMWVLHRLDYYGRVPYSLVKADPNYATCFITNLGSIGLKAGYHHLSNWGTNSIFIVIGEKSLQPHWEADGSMSMREVLPLGLTLDERIADGYYYSKTVKLLKYLLQNPRLLETPANEEVDDETI